jgi:proline dehydrogenase
MDVPRPVKKALSRSSLFVVEHVLPDFVSDPLARHVGSRYFAGETMEDVIATASRFHGHGVHSLLNPLKEHVDMYGAGIEAVRYVEAVRAIAAAGLAGTGISVKLSQLGMRPDGGAHGDDYDHAGRLFEHIIAEVKPYSMPVWIDMEDSRYTDRTLQMWRELRQSYDSLGLRVQSRLKRTVSDVEKIIRDHPNKQLRIGVCKGIYPERDNAYQKPSEIRKSHRTVRNLLWSRDHYVADATHDLPLVDEACKELGAGKRGEIAFLVGVNNERLVTLAKNYPAGIYLPFGPWEDGKPYAIRRMKENPDLFFAVVGAPFRNGKR